MNDAPDQVPVPVPQAPQVFARPEPPTPGSRSTVEDDGRAAASSRFPGTGDPRVDQAVAGLPDPQLHLLATDESAGTDGSEHRQVGGESTPLDEAEDTRLQSSLPDPALLDAHIGDVTTVHRLLQQRLSDLSG